MSTEVRLPSDQAAGFPDDKPGPGWFTRLAGWAGLLAALIGLDSLIAWSSHRPMFAPALAIEINMKANTALGLLCAGVALFLSARFPAGHRARKLAASLAVFIALLGLATFSEISFGWNLGIDEFLFNELPNAFAPFGPNRMVPATAVCLFFVGTALVLAEIPALAVFANVPAFLALGLSFPTLLGHFYGGSSFAGLGVYFYMAAPTSLAFQVLGTGILFLGPDRGSKALLIVRTAEGKYTLRLLLLVSTLFPLLGWFGLVGLERGLYRPEFGTALMVTVAGIAVTALVLWNARAAVDLAHARRMASRHQAELAAIIESSNDAIAGKDLHGRITSWNSAAVGLFGFTRDEMLGQPNDCMVPPERREDEALMLEKFSRGERVVNFETQRLTKDGRLLDVAITVSPVCDATGKLIGSSRIARDITAQKRAERAERAAAERLAHLLRSSPAILYTLQRRDGHLVPALISENIEHVVGYTPDEARAPRWWADHLFADDRALAFAHMAAIETSDEIAHEYRFICKDGRVVWIHDKLHWVRDAAGQPIEIVGAWTDITERKQAEAQLTENEERLRLALQAANQGLYDLDIPSGRAQVSPEYATMLGYDPADFHETNQAWLERTHPDDREATAAAFRDYVAGRTDEYRIEFRQRTRDGQWKWILSRGKILERGPDGEPRRMLGTHTDVNERKLAEQKIRRLSQLYEALSHCNQAIVRCRSEEQLFAEICRAAVEFGGLKMAWVGTTQLAPNRVTPVAFHGENTDYLSDIHITVAADDPRSRGPTGTSVRENRPVWIQDFLHDSSTAPWHERGKRYGWGSSGALPLTRSGAVIGAFTLYSGEPFFFDEQTRNLLVEMAADISYALENFAHEAQRKKALAALHLQSAALAATVDSVVITNVRGEIEWVNPAFTKITGYEPAEVIGRKPSILKSGRQADAYYAEMWKTISTGRSWSGEFVNRRKDGSLFTEEVTIAPVRDQSGAVAHYVAVKQDITEKQSLEKQLFQTQRLEGIGMLASGIAHDLNNVLAPISLSIELLRVQYPDSAQKLDMIEKSCRRGADIIRQVLTFARGADGERNRLQVGRLVKEMAHMISETFPRNIEIAAHVPRLNDNISGDPTQIHQVLLNLCVNARDAMPFGGRLDIGVERATLDEAAARAITGARPGEFVAISIRDTGTGIPPEIMVHIFEPFFTTKPRGQGTGLGLSTVHGIVRSHNGFIEVRSQPGIGTEFRVHLPALPADEHSGATAASATPFGTGRGELILVADDEISIREITSLVLERQGYTPLLAKNGTEALALFETNRDKIKLVILDRMMPGANGEDIARAIHETAPALPIFLSTGLITEGQLPGKEDELKRAGIRGILHKPYSEAVLLKLVSETLGA